MVTLVGETKPCSRCGKCCTHAGYMGSLSATPEDVKRWRREGRDDILRFVAIIGSGKNPSADLWVTPDGIEKLRCPFVRKDPNKPTYRCTIYETRPEVCRDYVPWATDRETVCQEV